jgi:hypothetical protein
MKNMEAETMKTLHSLVAGLWPASLILAWRMAFPLLFLGAGIVFVQPCAGAPFEFEQTGSLNTARYLHTATLLPNGKVLVAGGFGALASAELYDPASGTWTATGNLATARDSHTATLLLNGKVLVAAGLGNGIYASAELYDPASGTWTATRSLATLRELHTAALLPNGKVLVAGGYGNGFLTSTELYDVGLGFSSVWQPEIQRLKVTGGKRLLIKGSLFQGISQASGGNTQDSSSNYPIVQLRSIDNSEIVFAPVDPAKGWSDTRFISRPVRDFPFGRLW